MDHWYAFFGALFVWCFIPSFLEVVRRGRCYIVTRARRPTPHWRADLKARQQMKQQKDPDN